MVAKLHAYRLDDDWEYPTTDILSFAYNTLYSNSSTVFHPSLAVLNSVDTTYGLTYRVMEALVVTSNGSVEVTKAIVLTWRAANNVPNAGVITMRDGFGVGGWTNGTPANGATITVSLVNSKPYINPEFQSVIDISGDIIDDTLIINKEIESIEKFDLLVSSASVEIAETTAIKSFMDTYWTADKVVIGGVGMYFALGLEIEGRFVGYVAPENVIYDKEIGVYYIDAFDWIKFLQETKWNNFIPAYKSPNLTTFLSDNCMQLPGKSININVNDMSLDWETLDYRAHLHNEGDVSTWFYRSLRDMSVTSFIVETLKHYNGVLYYNGSGNLIFKNRSTVTSTIHENEEDIISESLEESYSLRDYDGIMINAKGEWRQYLGGWAQWEGWVVIWLEEGEMQVKTMKSDLSNLDEGFKYLDLRQDFNGLWSKSLIFEDRTREQRLADYRELLENQPVFEFDVDGLGYSLYDVFEMDGNSHRIIEAREDDTNSITSLRIEKYNPLTVFETDE